MALPLRLRVLSASLLALSLVGVLLVANAPAAQAATNGIKVSGTSLLNNANAPVKLRGVNRSGAEYSCGWGGTDFYRAFDKSQTPDMLAWNINMVRIPLNEHCWLGIDGRDQSTGPVYRQATIDYVNHLNANNVYVVLDLHFTHPWGRDNGEQRNVMANYQYSIPFWSSVASTFKSNPSVMFELYNEPHDLRGTSTEQWQCWLNGCQHDFRTAGMQEMLDAVRDAGARNVVIVNGLDWGHDMRRMLEFLPSDPAGQLVAGQHLYDFKRCVDEACWNAEFKPIAQVLPFLTPEIGVDACEGTFITRYMNWVDANGGEGYGFWSWTRGNCPAGERYGGAALLDWDGTPSNYGEAVKDHFVGSTTPGTTTTTRPPSTTTTTTRPTTTTTRPTTTTTTRPPNTTTTTGVPTATTTTTRPVNTTTTTQPPAAPTDGYRTVSVNGEVRGYGNQRALPGPAVPAGTSIVAMANTNDDRGYWLAASDGRVFAYGSAQHSGDAGAVSLNAPIVGMAAQPNGNGYWLLARDGGVFSFGGAKFFGSTGSLTLNSPVVAMVPAPDGNGYWFTAADGGVFNYGPSAAFRGSMGGSRLNKPVVGMTAHPDNRGYWLVASDGGVFSFDVPFLGSTGDITLNAPVVGIVTNDAGNGYRFIATDGGVFTFGETEFYGSGGSTSGPPVMALSS